MHDAPPVTTDDRSLVESLRRGDAGAARTLVERFQNVIFGLCYRMLGHRQDAEDVVQDVFVRAIRAASGFDQNRPLRPWLLGIAANRCRTVLARRARRPRLFESPEQCIDTRPPLNDPDDLAGELERALQLLRHEYRTVFVMFHEQGLAYEEIGAVLERPVGTVKTWLHRARAELADHLTRRGITDKPQPPPVIIPPSSLSSSSSFPPASHTDSPLLPRAPSPTKTPMPAPVHVQATATAPLEGL